MVITPGKNFEGQKGFPTPSNHPDDTACRIFVLPDDDEWLGLLMGAVELLLNPHNFYNWGALSIDDTVDAWAAIVEQAYAQSMTGVCAVAVPTPWWDTVGDADDEAAALTQTWYGYVTFPPALLGFELLDDPPPYTFIERIQDWVIAAFIVYAGQPAAAVFFLTIAPKFRLAWKTGNLGGLVRVFVDAVEYGRVDTFSESPGEVHLDVYHTDPDLDEHELVVILDDDSSELRAAGISPVMQIIRKKLDPSEVANPQVRYNPETDSTESDFNGDGDWSPNPGLDIRSSPAALFPPVDADDPRCQAAANMTRYISDFINDVSNTLGWATAAEGLLTTVMGAVAIIFPEGAAIGVFALLGLDLATTLFSAGVTAVQAAFDNTTLDTLTCIFLCGIESDGSVSPDDLVQLESDIGDQIGGLAAIVIDGMFLLMGSTGLSNAGARGDAPSDCSTCPTCDCPPELDWCEDLILPDRNYDGGFVASSEGIWSGYGEYGWAGLPEGGNWHPSQCVNRGSVERATLLNASLTLPSGHYTYLRVDWAVIFGTFTTDIRAMEMQLDGTPVISSTTDEGDVVEHEVDIDTTGTPVLKMNAVLDYINPFSPPPSCTGFCRIVRVTVGGLGTKPSF